MLDCVILFIFCIASGKRGDKKSDISSALENLYLFILGVDCPFEVTNYVICVRLQFDLFSSSAMRFACVIRDCSIACVRLCIWKSISIYCYLPTITSDCFFFVCLRHPLLFTIIINRLDRIDLMVTPFPFVF